MITANFKLIFQPGKRISRLWPVINAQRHVSYVDKNYKSVVYSRYGDPNEVLELIDNHTMDKKLSANEVILKVLMSPVNPADINMIQGVYAIKPPLPAVGGNEGIAEVVEVGSSVKKLKIGSWAIPKVPASPGSGMWTELLRFSEQDLLEIPNDLPVVSAATLAVNPCTAYRMLKDFVPLHKNDTVIQNASNSGVGINVIQIAKHLGINTVNIIRSRENEDEVRGQLKDLGATYVVTEAELKTECIKEIFSKIPRAKLALNAVGGKSTVDLCKHMAKGSTMVVYGGMSRQPLMVPVGSMIFSDISVKGFWVTRWVQENHDSPERQRMMEYLSDLIRNDKLRSSKASLHGLDDYKKAIDNAMQPFINSKQILVFDNKYIQ